MITSGFLDVVIADVSPAPTANPYLIIGLVFLAAAGLGLGLYFARRGKKPPNDDRE